MAMVQATALPLAALLTSIIKDELARHTYKTSNMHDLVSFLCAPLIIFVGTQVLFLLRSNKSIGTGNFLAGLAFACIYNTMFTGSYVLGYRYSFALQLALEAGGVLFSLVITELITGRKIKMERNALIVLTVAVALGGFYLRSVREPRTFALLAITFFIIFASMNVLKYIVAISQDPVTTLLIASGIVVIMAAFDYHEGMPYEFKKISQDMLANSGTAICLVLVTLANILISFFAFKYVEIDTIFIYKCLHLLIHVICTETGFSLLGHTS